MTRIVNDLKKVIEKIPDDSVIALGGFDFHRTPHMAVEEIVRQKKKNLTVAQVSHASSSEYLVASGVMKKIIMGYYGMEKYSPTSKILREAYKNGSIEIENYSIFSLVLRYIAGALNMPFFPSNLLEGTDMGKEFKKVVCPYSEEEYTALPPFNPDFSIIAVEFVDKDGNGVSSSYPYVNIDQYLARASKNVILIGEKLIDRKEMIEKSKVGCFFPNNKVSAATVMSGFCRPNSHYPHYDMDVDRIKFLVEKGKSIDMFRKEVIDKL